MKKNLLITFLLICTFLLSSTLIFAQLPTVIPDDHIPSKTADFGVFPAQISTNPWLGTSDPFIKPAGGITSSYSYQVTNPILSFSESEFTTAAPWINQTGYNLGLNTLNPWSGSRSSFTTDYFSSVAPLGSTTSLSQTLNLPHVVIDTQYSAFQSGAMTAWGPRETVGVSSHESVIGKPTQWTGLHPQLEAVNILHSMGPAQILAMDRQLAENAVIIGGQRVYLTSAYVNTASSSNYFYPEHVTSTTAQFTSVGGYPVVSSVVSRSYTPSTSYYPIPPTYYGYDYRTGATTATGSTVEEVIEEKFVEDLEEGFEDTLIEGSGEGGVPEFHSGSSY